MLNNREIAWVIWIAVLLIFMLWKPGFRQSLSSFFRTAFGWKLNVLYGIIILYTTGIVYFLWKIGLWDLSQLKNTLFWLFTVPVISLFDAHKSEKANYLSKAVKDVLAFTAIIQFIVGVYSFSLGVELLFVPIIVMLAGTFAVARTKKEYAPVKKLLFGSLTLAGLLLIGYTIYKISADYKSFVNQGTLNDFLVPAALTFLYLPLLYALDIYVYYDDMFATLSLEVKNSSLRRYIIWKALLAFQFRKSDLQQWRTYLFLEPVTSRLQVENSINFIKTQKKLEKNPPEVPLQKGWSPYSAKKFLAPLSLITGLYKPVFENEWHACSPYLKLDEDFLANNIAYYISGNQWEATRLKLEANIHSPERSAEVNRVLLKHAQMLYQNGIKQKWKTSWSDKILSFRNFKLIQENIVIQFQKTEWLNHKENGFSLVFEMHVNNQ